MNTSFIYLMGIVMITVGVGFLYMLLKGSENHRPKDGMEWAGAILSGALVLAALALMVTAGEGSSTARPESREADLIEDFSLAVPASDFSFTGVNDDRQWTLSDFDGKVVIINFWATWCAPCRVEIPDLNRLQDKYRYEGLVILSISDEPKNLLVRWEETVPMRTYRMRVPEFIELPTPFTDSFVLRPTTFIIDREGIVRRYLLGPRSFDFFENAVEPYL